MLIVKAISLWAFACERQGRKQNNAEKETVEGERKKFLDFYCFACSCITRIEDEIAN